MEISILRSFLAVATEETITGAANALHLSQQIKKMNASNTNNRFL